MAAAVRTTSSPQPHLNWAIIGCGVIANQFAQSLALAGRTVYGVANRTHSKAEAFAREHGVERVYDSFEDLYEDPDVDCVYITTPHNTHITYLRAALAAGKHVLCEKAITLNSVELEEARTIADEHGVVLMDATTVLHMPLYVELMRRAESGEFGRLRLAQVNFGSFHDYEDVSNRFWNRNLAGGAMLDIGVYALSVARLFMESQPNEVVSLANLFETGVDEESGFVTRNAQGQLGVFSLRCTPSSLARDPVFRRLLYRGHGVSTRRSRRDHLDGGRASRGVKAGVEAYALCYEVADLESAVAGDASKLKLIDVASDVMKTMTRLRADWGVVYPEEE